MATLQVDFDWEDREIDPIMLFDFWDTTRAWLAERGYTLYELGHRSKESYNMGLVPKIVFPEGNISPDDVHPYAFFGGDPPDLPVAPLMAYSSGRVAFAQDAQHRHVALKLVKAGSVECEIAQLLLRDTCHLSLQSFAGIVPPLELLDAGEHMVIVMPRWGDLAQFPWFSAVHEVLEFMRCCLKALDYLHRNHIVHRDISHSNCVVNQFCACTHEWYSVQRIQLRKAGRLVYGLIDYELAVRFPADAPPAARRLPYRLSWQGGWHQPHDTAQGELDYDPFAFDVGCLGVVLCTLFQIAPTVPMLAPLLDKMTTRDVARRFTARQALDFLEGFASTMTPEALDMPVPADDGNIPHEDFDRWRGLPEEFVRRWAHYREPGLPLWTRLLRGICRHDWGRVLVQLVRRMLRFAGLLLKK